MNKNIYIHKISYMNKWNELDLEKIKNYMYPVEYKIYQEDIVNNNPLWISSINTSLINEIINNGTSQDIKIGKISFNDIDMRYVTENYLNLLVDKKYINYNYASDLIKNKKFKLIFISDEEINDAFRPKIGLYNLSFDRYNLYNQNILSDDNGNVLNIYNISYVKKLKKNKIDPKAKSYNVKCGKGKKHTEFMNYKFSINNHVPISSNIIEENKKIIFEIKMYKYFINTS